MPPMTGRVVAGRYNLQHPIGRGAMGVVWRARDQLLDRDVAVKEVVISALIGAEERRNAYQRTLREARTAARLSHRGVVAVYDVAEEDGRPWIIMELVPSRSLDEVLTTERRLTPLRTGRIGQQLLSALAAAHIAGVLHRDVKPSNVLIATDRGSSGWDERAVLTDFGIAQFEGDPRLTQTGMVMGSPGFTAPERIRGGDASPASDLWSLGATLYAAAEGRGPYEQRGGAITTMSAIINEDAPVAAHAGPLGPVIAALLRREPSARPSASAAARMFAQLLPQLVEAAKAAERAHEATHPPTVRVAVVPAVADMAPDASAPEAEPADGELASEASPAPEAEGKEAEGQEAEGKAEREPDADPPTVPSEVADPAAPAPAPAPAAPEAAAQAPADLADASAPKDAGAVPAAGVMLLAAASGPEVPATIIDRDRQRERERDEYRPTELSIPTVNPAAGPRFTASQRKEPAVPTFSAARPGTTAPPAGAGGQYAGPSQLHPDLAGQYTPGTGGGRSQRRRSPWRWIILVFGAVVLAAAIGAGAAFALGHHGAGSGATGPGPSGTGTVASPARHFLSVDALNHPSAAVPAGWTPVPVTAAEAHSRAGFTIDLPPGWTEIRQSSLATTFDGPGGMFLEIDLTPHTYPVMVTEARYIERRSTPAFTGYKLLHLQGVPVRGTAGAIWQFQKTSASGVLTTADDILFTATTSAGPQSYAIYIRAPSDGWGSTYLPAFDQILPTFQTVPAS